MKVFVARDAAALAVGADRVAAAIAAEAEKRQQHVTLVRTGTRGMLWLEPLIEVATPEGRVGYGPVTPADVPSLFDAGFLEGRPHPRRAGQVEELPFFKRQTRLIFARAGLANPLSLSDYRILGGLHGLDRALTLGPEQIVAEVKRSGLRGRGGAGFPTGIKWESAARAQAARKYIVCNADEGDSGTFADRILMEGDPFTVIEGMLIAAIAVGATRGFIYIRSEYPHAIRAMASAIEIARREGILGPHAAGSNYAFDIEIRVGAGAYICGEETSLLESLEGKRGMVRAKPPLPVVSGLFGQPTVINNLVTFSSVPFILAQGGQAYADMGVGRSRGTMPVQLAGNVRHGGVFECAFGVTLGELVNEIGGGTASGRPVRAVQAGGPLGAYLPPALFDTPYDYEAFAAHEGLIGHGGLVVFDDTVNLARMARFAMEFCAHESCGKCTPCRIGSRRGVEVLDRILAGRDREQNIALLGELCETLRYGSLCALGGLVPYPVLSALKHFPEDFGLAVLPSVAAAV